MGNIKGVYEIKNIKNGKMYIGSSKDIETRWKQHKSMLNNGKHHSQHLQYAWDKYGEDSFVFNILQSTKNQEKLFSYEQKWMDKYKSYNPEYGYNISRTANGCSPNVNYDMKKILQQDERFIQKEIELQKKHKTIRSILNKEIENKMNLNPEMNFKYRQPLNELVYSIYLYFIMIDYNTWYDLTIFSGRHTIHLQNLYEFSMDLCERIIFNNKIDMIHIRDSRYDENTLIYADHFIYSDLHIDARDVLQIQYHDGFQLYNTKICDNTQ